MENSTPSARQRQAKMPPAHLFEMSNRKFRMQPPPSWMLSFIAFDDNNRKQFEPRGSKDYSEGCLIGTHAGAEFLNWCKLQSHSVEIRDVLGMALAAINGTDKSKRAVAVGLCSFVADFIATASHLIDVDAMYVDNLERSKRHHQAALEEE